MFRVRVSFACLLFVVSLFGGASYAVEENAAEVMSRVESLQERMKSDPKIIEMIQSLQDDPEFLKVLQDPSVISAINSGDISALQSNPQFMKLLNNSTVQKIQKKVQE